jgi:hypothetical protein
MERQIRCAFRKLGEGERFHADFDISVVLAINMAVIATRLDQQVASKFKTKTKNCRHWRKPIK